MQKYIQFNYERHFGGVQFQGRYLIPTRKWRLCEITHGGVRKAMRMLKAIAFVAATTCVISMLASIAQKLA